MSWGDKDNHKNFEVIRDKDLVPMRKEGYPTIDPGTDTLREQTAICPECHSTIIRSRTVSDTYYCGNCHKAFPSAEAIDARG